jgi:multiple antibiotic resistance protein
VSEIFLLLLIGIGPKIALVPFLELTADLPQATKRRVQRKMLTTATVVAIVLLVLGGLLTKLLHFSPGALAIAGGIILLIIAVSMVLGRQQPEPAGEPADRKDPMRLAAFPLAVPYLLNPVGIVVLVTISAEAASFGFLALVVGLLVVVLAIDVAVFHWAGRVAEHLNEDRMLVTEKVFGFLLAAIAVELVLDGLSSVGVIHLAGH